MISAPKLIGWGEGEGLVGANIVEFVVESIYGQKDLEPDSNVNFIVPTEPHIYMYRIGPNYQGEGDNWYCYEGYVSTCDTYFTNNNGITLPPASFEESYNGVRYSVNAYVETNPTNTFISLNIVAPEAFTQDTEFNVELWKIV